MIATRYRRAGKADRGKIVDELCATTGWHRSHARKALGQALRPQVVRPRRPRRDLTLIRSTLEHGRSNARSEATNVHLRVLTRRAYGYHSPDALIAMAMLTRGDLCPPLPGR